MTDILFEQIDPRKLLAGIAAIVLLVCTVQVMYLLLPQWKRYAEVDESHTLLTRINASGGGLSMQLASIEKEVADLSRQLHGDMAELPAKQMESYIIGRLQRVSWNTGVELIGITPGIGQQVQMFREGLFDVQLHAGYHDFIAWLKRIGEDLGFIIVKKYHIAPVGQQATDATLNIRLTMVAYRMVDR